MPERLNCCVAVAIRTISEARKNVRESKWEMNENAKPMTSENAPSLWLPFVARADVTLPQADDIKLNTMYY